VVVVVVGLPVEHGPQDLCRHDEACGCRVDGDVTGHEAHITKLLLLVRREGGGRRRREEGGRRDAYSGFFKDD